MERKRIFFLVLLWLVLILRAALTVLTLTVLALTGVQDVFPFSMFSMPFLLASAFISPRLSFGLLLGYVIIFVLALFLLPFRKTRAGGVLCFAVTVLADLCAMILSAAMGSNQYYLIGIPVCVIALLVCALCFRAARRQTDETDGNVDFRKNA